MEKLLTTMEAIIIVIVLLAISQLLSARHLPEEENAVQDLSKFFKFADNLEAALQTAEIESKPVMLIVHTSKCKACVGLRPKLIESNDLQLASNDFVMVNDLDGVDQQAESYGPDGKYYPRIIFFGCNGKVLTTVNSKSEKYKYYYTNAGDIIQSMEKALDINEGIIRREDF